MLKTSIVVLALLSVSPAGALEYNTDNIHPNKVESGVDDWMGFAASPQGRVFRTDSSLSSEESARYNARITCERTTGRTCSSTLSVPSNYDVVAMRCYHGGTSAVFFGGSQLGQQEDVALTKARDAGFRPGNCHAIVRY